MQGQCDTLAGFTVYFYFLSRMYSACISHELQLVIQNPTYNVTKSHACYHIASNSLSLAFVVLFAWTDHLGMSSSLMCWNKFTPDILTNKYALPYPQHMCDRVPGGPDSVHHLQSLLPLVQDPHLPTQRGELPSFQLKGYLVRYSVYLIAEILVDIERVVQMFIASLDDRYFMIDPQYSILRQDGFATFRFITVGINIFTPLFLSLIRLTEPDVQRIIRRSCCGCLHRYNRLNYSPPREQQASFIQLIERSAKEDPKVLDSITSNTANSSTLVSESDRQQEEGREDHTVKESSVLIVRRSKR